MRNPWKNRKPR